MTNRPEEFEGTSRRKLLRTGAAAVPMMVTIKAASAQVAGGNTQGLLASVACLRHAEIPMDYRDALQQVADKLGLSEGSSETLTEQGGVEERSGGWLGTRMGSSLRQEEGLVTQSVNGETNYQDWTYEEFEEYFAQGQLDFYPGVEYDPGSQYHNTFLEITVSTACWASIETQMTS